MRDFAKCRPLNYLLYPDLWADWIPGSSGISIINVCLLFEWSKLCPLFKSRVVINSFFQVVDEADKAPLHVTCILKTLVESGEMMLSDGRRIVSRPDLFKDDDVIVMHQDFRMIVLANRPGFCLLFFGPITHTVTTANFLWIIVSNTLMLHPWISVLSGVGMRCSCVQNVA